MLSILVAVRNSRAFAGQCLHSLLASVRALNLDAEFIVIDDCSAPDQDILALLREFRAAAAPIPVRIIRFDVRQHYTRSLAYGLSACGGGQILFISHDMIVPPPCLQTLLQTSAAHPQSGILRPTSRHMDGAPQHAHDPGPIKSGQDVVRYSAERAAKLGPAFVEDVILIADAMLLSRSVIDRIGVFDTRYPGFFGDIDYGLRAQLAGFKLGTALGAWLHHEGAAASKDDVASGRLPLETVNRQITGGAEVGYQVFRAKWNADFLPPLYPGLDGLQLPRLRETLRGADESLVRSPPLSLPADQGRFV